MKHDFRTWSEDKLQGHVFQQTHNLFPELRRRLFAVPNGGNRSPTEAQRLKATGTTAGVFDLVLIANKAIFVAIEAKKPFGGRIDPYQQKQALRMDENGVSWFVFNNPLTFFRILEMKTDINPDLVPRYQVPHELIIEEYKHTMKAGEGTFKARVYIFLMKVKPETKIELAQYIEEKNLPRFIELTKEFINLYFDRAHDFELTFSNDYSVLYKHHVNYGKRTV